MANLGLSHIDLFLVFYLCQGALTSMPAVKVFSGLENLEQLLYLCILWFWILNTAPNYQSYTYSTLS